MAIDRTNFAFDEPAAVAAQPELLVSAVLHLMSHYTANANDAGTCIKLASVIERHLRVLADLPGLAPVLRATCRQLSEQWEMVVERSMPHPAKSELLAKLTAAFNT